MRRVALAVLTGFVVLVVALAGFAVETFTQHFLLVAPDKETLTKLEGLAEPSLTEVSEFWGLDPESLFTQAQAELLKLLPYWVNPPDWVSQSAAPRIAIVVTNNPNCAAWLSGCVYRVIQAAGGHLSLFPPLKHKPFPGDLGIEIRLPENFSLPKLKSLLAESLLFLYLGVDAQPKDLWSIGVAGYTEWQLDPTRMDWPYRALGKLITQELNGEFKEFILTRQPSDFSEFFATCIAFVEKKKGREAIFPLIKSVTLRPLVCYQPNASDFQKRLGLAPDEFLKAWWAWLSEAGVTEAARVWYISWKYELAKQLYLLAPLIPPDHVAKAKTLLAAFPSQGT